jgi:hypothetical protein
LEKSYVKKKIHLAEETKEADGSSKEEFNLLNTIKVPKNL